jgi:NHLM bacteriocin system ABC transporter peptidase/ATP-binding protein
MAYKRVKTPTVLQIEAVECGAACLSIVLSYFGRHEPLETLRGACGVSRDGSKAANILRAARSFGLNCRGYKKEPAELRQMRPPFIVFWAFDHFVVLEGFSGRKIYLNDPATGPRVVTEQEFDESFTGIALAFEPSSGFRPRPGKGLWPSVRRRLRNSYAGIVYAALATLALAVPLFIVPVLSRVFIDSYLVERVAKWAQPLLVMMSVCAILIAALTYLQQTALLRLETRMAITGASEFFWRTLRLPMEFFAHRSAGEVAYRLGINDRLAALLGGEVSTNLANLLLAGAYIGLMLQYDRLLTAIGVCIAAVNFLLLKLASRLRTVASRKMAQDRGKLQGVTVNVLRGIETVKASGAESGSFSLWAGQYAKVVNGEQKLGAATQWLNAVSPLLDSLNFAAIVCIGGVRVMDGLLTIGLLISFQSLVAGFLAPVSRLVALGGSLQEARGHLTLIDDAMRIPCAAGLADEERQDAEFAARCLQGEVEFRNVTFGYSPLNPPLIQDFSLKLPAGSRIALVGASGSGKSTVAKLLAGLYEPWNGTILFDGIPRKELPRRTLTNSVALVDQEILLFEGTIRDNIALWDDTVAESAMVQAARDAAIHYEIMSRPNGYQHRVEEGGWNLSGGQRQRLELARALAASPRVLVLDEATSALDTRAEALVDDSLRRRGCTCLIVAHRLSTIRHCDLIVVLDGGRVVEQGTHSELLSAGGAYAKLIACH